MRIFLTVTTIVLHCLVSSCNSQCLFNYPAIFTNFKISSEREFYAKKIASYMDTTTDPCDDFNQYACGNYFKVNRANKGSHSSVLHVIGYNLQQDLAQILSETAANESEHSADAKARKIFQQCMAEDIFNYKAREAYLELIQSMGGWPAMNPDWNPEEFDWFETVLKMKMYGVDILTVESRSDEDDCDVQISSNQISLHSADCFALLEPKSTADKINEKIAIFLLDKYNVPKSKAEIIFKDYGTFSRKLCKFSLLSLFSAENKTTIEELINTIPEFDWEKYYSNVFGKEYNVSLPVCVDTLKYFEKLADYMNNNDTKAKKVIANAIILQFLSELHDEYQYPKYKTEYCVQEVQKYMEPVLNSLYIRSHYHRQSSEDEVLVMTSYVKSALRSRIKTTKWLDKHTRQGALKKLKFLHANIDDTDATLDTQKLDKKYQDLNVTSDSFYENLLALRKFYTSHKYEDDVEYFSIEVNAYYAPDENELYLPAGILHKPMYYPELPKSYNFGTMGGSIIGHEIGHGFDPTGIDYNENGEELNWWTNETRKIYDEKVQCFVDQYNQYTIEGLTEKMDGKSTLDENVADHIGMKIGYHAYKKWIESNTPEIDLRFEVLSGLNLTNWQLYFVSLAQTQCEWHNFKGAKKVSDDVHTQGKWRNIGLMVNSEEFAKEFACPIGSPMNPAEKCSIW